MGVFACIQKDHVSLLQELEYGGRKKHDEKMLVPIVRVQEFGV